jgi:hypothetical protein
MALDLATRSATLGKRFIFCSEQLETSLSFGEGLDSFIHGKSHGKYYGELVIIFSSIAVIISCSDIDWRIDRRLMTLVSK